MGWDTAAGHALLMFWTIIPIATVAVGVGYLWIKVIEEYRRGR